jgi:hypothetical protein
MVKGTIKYVPKEVVEYLDSCKSKFNIRSDSEAFRKMIEDSKVGRDIKLSIDLNFGRKNRR